MLISSFYGHEIKICTKCIIFLHALQHDTDALDQKSVSLELQKHMENCREILRVELYLLNPCMRMTLEQWMRDYRYT